VDAECEVRKKKAGAVHAVTNTPPPAEPLRAAEGGVREIGTEMHGAVKARVEPTRARAQVHGVARALGVQKGGGALVHGGARALAGKREAGAQVRGVARALARAGDP
jgi:hypothetical protein